MSIFSRLINRVWPGGLARDLHDEVAFHIHMRADENCNAGMSVDEAAKHAREQFGDVDSVVSDMRKERLASPAVVLTTTAVVFAVIALWITQQRIDNSDRTMPAVPAVRIFTDPGLRSRSAPPPRPRPGPTWEEFVKQRRAFEALETGPGVYAPGRLLDDDGSLIDDKAKPR